MMDTSPVNVVAAPEKRVGGPARLLRYVLIMPVWGDHHTGLFLRYFIPFLMTDGNVGAFPDRSLRVHVTSRRADLARMREDANYQKLSATVDLIETEIDNIIDLSVPHRAMTECYLYAVRRIEKADDTVTIFPTPDCILSRNSLTEIVTLMEAGWRGIMVCGLRLTLESSGPLLDRMLAHPGGANGIDERELCSVVLDNLHPITLTCDVASDQFMFTWPSHVYWTAPDRTWLIAHCFHLHPLAVRGVPKLIDIHTTIDGGYLMGLGADANQLYVVADSDHFFCVELSPHAKVLTTNLGRLKTHDLVRFSMVGCNPLHMKFFAKPIKWRGQSEPKIPADVAAQAAMFVAAVERGSIVEKGRHIAISTINRYSALSIPARFLRRCWRFAHRRLLRAKAKLTS